MYRLTAFFFTLLISSGALAEAIPEPDPTAPPPGEVQINMEPKKPPGEDVVPLQIPLNQIPNYRQFMRDMAETLISYGKSVNPNFVVLTKDGFELFAKKKRELILDELKDPTGVDLYRRDPVGTLYRQYIQAVDGVVVENLHCGEPNMDEETLAIMRDNRKTIFSYDHCSTPNEAMMAVERAIMEKGLAHVDLDQSGKLDRIPAGKPFRENPDNVFAPADAQNMLANVDNSVFRTKDNWLIALQNTNYDLLVIDPYYRQDNWLTPTEVESLKYKRLGAKRLVFASMDVSLALDSRPYWNKDWRVGFPAWIDARDRKIPGGHFTEFWSPGWKEIVGTYFAAIVKAGYDGVVLEGLNGYEYWEWRTPVE